MIFIMRNFLEKIKHKHNFEDVIWYRLYYDAGYGLKAYRAKCCSCGKVKESRSIYNKKFSTHLSREDKIDWWEGQGAITEEEFALKYK